MLKHLMSGASLLALAVRDKENEQGTDERSKLREQLAKGTVTIDKVPDVVAKEADADEVDEDEEEIEEEAEAEAEEDGGKVEETEEEKTAREAKEAEASKTKRSQERIQKRIDKAVAGQKAAEAELLKLKQQLEANPDKKLTEEEVQSRAEAIAAEKVAAKEMERVQLEFNKACDKLQDAANKLDDKFDIKVRAMAEELGPIPTRVINIISDLDNGAEVLKFLVDDIDKAEEIYDLNNRPEKLAIALVRISDKIEAAKAPKPKPISKVPDAVKPVNGTRVHSTAITGNDTKPENMDSYVRKRQQQKEALRKERGY